MLLLAGTSSSASCSCLQTSCNAPSTLQYYRARAAALWSGLIPPTLFIPRPPFTWWSVISGLGVPCSQVQRDSRWGGVTAWGPCPQPSPQGVTEQGEATQHKRPIWNCPVCVCVGGESCFGESGPPRCPPESVCSHTSSTLAGIPPPWWCCCCHHRLRLRNTQRMKVQLQQQQHPIPYLAGSSTDFGSTHGGAASQPQEPDHIFFLLLLLLSLEDEDEGWMEVREWMRAGEPAPRTHARPWAGGGLLSRGVMMKMTMTTTTTLPPCRPAGAVRNGTSLLAYDTPDLLQRFFHAPKHNRSFEPEFSPSEEPGDPLGEQMASLCQADPFCRFDVLTTRDLAVGNSTRLAHQNYKRLLRSLQPVVSCGWLASPSNGKKEGTDYLSGSYVRFSCNPGYRLAGSAERMCQGSGAWSGVSADCLPNAGTPQARPFGLLLLLLLLLLLGMLASLSLAV